MFTKFLVREVALALRALSSNGCAVYMAANQSSKKDVSVQKVGNPRSLVIA